MRMTEEELGAKLKENPDLKVNQGNPMPIIASLLEKKQSKYRAKRTHSALCGRIFSSKAEAKRGEELYALEVYGVISDLRYQVKFVLSDDPLVSIKIDFSYLENGERVFEDVKGMGETREFRVKRIWLEKSQGIKVLLTK